ncbi:RagB/SusD family nutrient uptake outer membrane protein [Chitinophaga sp.]|uniref:RagB/SusD family nutrient uptake outer membrane protein n=1 Tax=Chitinophaga sp. TaxID=1869181 RepID=UPI002C5D0ED3|nr:RagB/SusD family nutrient uptake outer membrane protein [Chitinophaga sp.]HWV66221.1 RagB/SusD family nutrient uptake outer membrane protein [Chitinophaga sp.]
MKKSINIVFLLLALASGIAGCQKSFLEVTPAGKIIAEKTNDYNLLLNSLTLGNQFMTHSQAMGDEMAAIEPYYSGITLQQQRSFQWEDNIYEPNEDAPEITYPTKALYVYNVVINEVLNSTGGTAGEKEALQAEALAGRAWVYLQLVNTFAKPFNSATAATDPGFPIVKEANVTMNSFPRATVKEVYDFIVDDLKAAIPNLSPTPYHRFRMSRPAAEALLGKTYLFMGMYNEALEQLTAAMTDLAASTYPVRLYDYNITFGPGGQFLPVTIFGPTLPNLYNNEESLYSRQTMGDWTTASNALPLSPATVALYGQSDLRRNFMSTIPYPSGAAFPLGMARKAGPFSPIIGMVVPDIYLMRAEVKARLNDLPGAKADIEALRVKRMPAADAPVPDAISTNKNTLVKFILEERIREFAGLGYRWFDMRRLSVDPDFKSTVNTKHIVYSATGEAQSTFTLRPERLTFKIPPKVLSQNPGMVDNQ